MTNDSDGTVTEPTYILTARLDPDSFAWLDDLRRTHFPSARNVLSAHLTMFHRLSAPQLAYLQAISLPSHPIALTFDAVVFLGAGNAIRAAAPQLEQLRAAVRAAIGDDISRQDAQRWMPHVTVQNKVPVNSARTLHAELAQNFRSRTGSATGLQVWEYLGGPWKLSQTLPFAAKGGTNPD